MLNFSKYINKLSYREKEGKHLIFINNLHPVVLVLNIYSDTTCSSSVQYILIHPVVLVFNIYSDTPTL